MRTFLFRGMIFVLCALPLSGVTMAASPADDVVRIVSDMMDSNLSFSGEYNGNFNSIISINADVSGQHHNGNQEVHEDGIISFDTRQLRHDFGAEGMPLLVGTLAFGGDMYYHQMLNQLIYQVRDLELTLRTEEEDQTDVIIGEGFFELVKFFTDKHVGIDLDIFTEMAEMYDDEGSRALAAFAESMKNQKEMVANVLDALFDSGMFTVEKAGSSYIIGLERDPTQIDPTVLFDLAAYFGISQAEIDGEKEAFLEYGRESFNAEWPEIVEHVSFQVQLLMKTLRLSEMRMMLQIEAEHEVISWNYETFESTVERVVPIRFGFNTHYKFSPRSQAVMVPMMDIDLGKYMHAMMAMMERERQRWEEWEAEYSEEAWSEEGEEMEAVMEE